MEASAQERPASEAVVAAGMAIALSVVLHFFRLIALPNGGSVTLASVLPIWIMARRYGLRAGLITGASTGCVLFVLKPVVVNPLQVLVDYPLAWGSVGLAGLTPFPILGALLSTVARFGIQVASGLTFYAHTFPKALDPMVFSLLYNLYLVPDMVIALALYGLLVGRSPELLGLPPKPREKVPASAASRLSVVAPALIILLGLGAVLVPLMMLRAKMP